MSDLIQLGQHPDADQLNAFVEHALPAHEREQTLAHLAGCAECREIVALSLPPLEEAPVVEADSVAKAGFGKWFSGWPLGVDRRSGSGSTGGSRNSSAKHSGRE